METIHFHYQSNPDNGSLDVSMGYNQTYLRSGDIYVFEHRSKVNSDQTPSQLLQRLEKLIVDEIGEKPCTNDLPEDKDPRFRDYPRSLGYLPAGTWSGLESEDDEDPQERKDVDKMNMSRHLKVFPIYQEFILDLQKT
ncbi:hypothetical protein GOV12_02580 [Candidatus Pacearchaeota archaeon]|nr:hypothetical protein [Candidatus Pacearchaeota archaeon]